MKTTTLLFLCLLVSGCETSGTLLRHGPPPFIGTWVGQVNIFQMVYTFNADGTYTAGSTGIGNSGHWSETGGKLHLTPDPLLPGGEATPPHDAAWAISPDGRSLTLTLHIPGQPVGVVVMQKQGTP